jgi:hypothetical protein
MDGSGGGGLDKANAEGLDSVCCSLAFAEFGHGWVEEAAPRRRGDEILLELGLQERATNPNAKAHEIFRRTDRRWARKSMICLPRYALGVSDLRQSELRPRGKDILSD